MIDSAFSPTTDAQPRHRADEVPDPPDRASASGARHRLLALMEDAGSTERAGPGPEPHEAGARSPTVLLARSGWARRFVQRWLPESWQQSRVDPGRAGCLGVGMLAVLVTVAVAVTTLSSRPAAEPVPTLPVVASVAATTATGSAPEHLVISLVGRVHDPGLVTVEPDARVADALTAAGGTLPDTNIRSLNLARKLVDGEQLYVGVPVPPGVPRPPQAGPAGSAASGPRSKVNLNTADKEALEELPGVGPVTAERIVQWRTDKGGFDSVEQLRAVNGIGEVKYSQLQDLVRV